MVWQFAHELAIYQSHAGLVTAIEYFNAFPISLVYASDLSPLLPSPFKWSLPGLLSPTLPLNRDPGFRCKIFNADCIHILLCCIDTKKKIFQTLSLNLRPSSFVQTHCRCQLLVLVCLSFTYQPP